MTTEIITQRQLKEVLFYSPQFGIFVWKVKAGPRGMKGKIAGSTHISGYRRIVLNKRTYKAHRLAFLYVSGRFPPDQVDHINGNRADNSFSNLREVCGFENARNLSIGKKNTSGVLGVSRNSRDCTWYASITTNGKYHHLGTFEDFFEACCTRKSAERKYGFHVNHGRAANK